MRLFSRYLKSALFPALCLCGVLYFTHYALNGSYGYGALGAHREEITRMEVDLALLRAQSEHLERRAALLRSDSLDPDLLDERARQLLGYAHPREIIIPIPSR